MARRGRRKRTWQQALRADNEQAAMYRYLIEVFGGKWGRWRGTPGEVRGRIAVAGEAFGTGHGLADEWVDPLGRPIRMAGRYIVAGYIPHLAHYDFGRPHRRRWWHDPHSRRRWFVGYDEAQRLMEAKAQAKARYTAQANEDQAVAAFRRRLRARRMRDDGFMPHEIAEVLGVTTRAVYGYLKQE